MSQSKSYHSTNSLLSVSVWVVTLMPMSFSQFVMNGAALMPSGSVVERNSRNSSGSPPFGFSRIPSSSVSA